MTTFFNIRDKETGKVLRTAETYSGGGGFGILIDPVRAEETHWDSKMNGWTDIVEPERRITYWDYDYEPEELASDIIGRPVELIAVCETDGNGRITKRYDKDGFGPDGLDWFGYDQYGLNEFGHEKWDDDYEVTTNLRGEVVRRYESDIDQWGFYPDGEHVNGTAYDDEGYNCEGFNREGRDREGFDRMGYGRDGFNRAGIDMHGLDRNGFLKTNSYGGGGHEDLQPGMNIHTGTYYGPDGFDEYGFAEDGSHRDGSQHFFDAANEVQKKLDAMDPMDDEYPYWTEKRRELAEEGQKWKRVENAAKREQASSFSAPRDDDGRDPIAGSDTLWSSEDGFGGDGEGNETIAVSDGDGKWRKIGSGLKAIGNSLGGMARSAQRAINNAPKTGDIDVASYDYVRNGKHIHVKAHKRKRS